MNHTITPTLKLVSETDVPDSFKFERRLAPRHSLHSRVTAMAVNEADEAGSPGSIGSLELFDQSSTGFGAWSDRSIPMGAKIALYFPAHGVDQGHDAYGEVVRSVKEGDRWSIGINLQMGKVAA